MECNLFLILNRITISVQIILACDTPCYNYKFYIFQQISMLTGNIIHNNFFINVNTNTKLHGKEMPSHAEKNICSTF